jgi:hypothetical protein
MLLNPTQFSQQGLMPQFAGQQAGPPQMGAGLFGQPGAYGANGYPPGAQPYPFAGQGNPFLQSSLTQSPFAQNPYLSGFGGAQHPAQQIVQILGQLVQHIFTQSALTQQIGIAIQQLAQITVQSLQSQQGQLGGQLGGQSFGLGGGIGSQGFGGGGQPFGQSPFGAQGGFGQQPQPWGLNRPPTIQ